MILNWRSYSDPEKTEALGSYSRYILSITSFEIDSWRSFLNEIRGKTVLDLGCVEHTLEKTQKEGWRHKKIKDSCERVVGIDIEEDVLNELNKQGYDIRCIDATSDQFIGEKFDYCFLGDIVEHVSNPVDLYKFAARHLKANGRVIVATPNPYYIVYILKNLKYRHTISNLQHVCWITESCAIEIGYRAKLRLVKIRRPVGSGFFSWVRKLMPGILIERFYYEYVGY